MWFQGDLYRFLFLTCDFQYTHSNHSIIYHYNPRFGTIRISHFSLSFLFIFLLNVVSETDFYNFLSWGQVHKVRPSKIDWGWFGSEVKRFTHFSSKGLWSLRINARVPPTSKRSLLPYLNTFYFFDTIYNYEDYA